MILISSCSRLCPIHWSQVLSWEWRCSWSSADRRCSNYIWVINNLICQLRCNLYQRLDGNSHLTHWGLVMYSSISKPLPKTMLMYCQLDPRNKWQNLNWNRVISIQEHTLIARFMGPSWGPSGADRTQVGPMLPPWTGCIWICLQQHCNHFCSSLNVSIVCFNLILSYTILFAFL